LFLDTPPTLAGSGFISLKLGTAGTWSATLRRGSVSAKATGSLGPEGVSTNRISFGSDPALTLELALQLDSISAELTGRMLGSGFEAPVLALRSYANPDLAYPRAGAYTFIIPGTNGAGRFAGDGFGSITVDSRGGLTLTASLADAAKAVQKVFISASDQWPIYVPLDGGRGVLAGWISFGDFGNENGRGSLRWLKAANSEQALYPDGSTNQVTLTASRYSPSYYPSGRLVDFERGTLAFDGDEVLGWSDAIDWSVDNRITSETGRPLVVRITSRSGLYTGQWTGANGEPVSFRGAIHQSGNFASGYFMSGNATGRAWFHASP
jgi:hypothetical protein